MVSNFLKVDTVSADVHSQIFFSSQYIGIFQIPRCRSVGRSWVFADTVKRLFIWFGLQLTLDSVYLKPPVTFKLSNTVSLSSGLSSSTLWVTAPKFCCLGFHDTELHLFKLSGQFLPVCCSLHCVSWNQFWLQATETHNDSGLNKIEIHLSFMSEPGDQQQFEVGMVDLQSHLEPWPHASLYLECGTHTVV